MENIIIGGLGGIFGWYSTAAIRTYFGEKGAMVWIATLNALFVAFVLDFAIITGFFTR